MQAHLNLHCLYTEKVLFFKMWIILLTSYEPSVSAPLSMLHSVHLDLRDSETASLAVWHLAVLLH